MFFTWLTVFPSSIALAVFPLSLVYRVVTRLCAFFLFLLFLPTTAASLDICSELLLMVFFVGGGGVEDVDCVTQDTKDS